MVSWPPNVGCHGLQSKNMAALVIFGIGTLLLGCGDDSKRISAETSSSQLAVPSVHGEQTTRQQETKALLAAGVKLERDDSDAVIEANFKDVVATDTLAAELSALSTLRKLVISNSELSVAGWQAVGKLSALQQLDLRDCPLNNEQLQAAAAGMPRLRALRLSGKSGATEVDDEGLQVLAGCKDLKALALDHLWVSGEGLQHLVHNKNLSEIYLAGTLVDDEATEIFQSFPKLRKLRLAQTSVGTPGLERIRNLQLEELDISECSQIFDDAMKPVGEMRSLKRLNLWRNALTDEGVRSLEELVNLQWLNLDNTQLSDDGLAYLSKMSKLSFLHLGSTGVSDAGMPALLALQSLEDLKVTRTAVTEEGVHVIQNGIPDVQVQLKYTQGQ